MGLEVYGAQVRPEISAPISTMYVTNSGGVAMRMILGRFAKVTGDNDLGIHEEVTASHVKSACKLGKLHQFDKGFMAAKAHEVEQWAIAIRKSDLALLANEEMPKGTLRLVGLVNHRLKDGPTYHTAERVEFTPRNDPMFDKPLVYTFSAGVAAAKKYRSLLNWLPDDPEFTTARFANPGGWTLQLGTKGSPLAYLFQWAEDQKREEDQRVQKLLENGPENLPADQFAQLFQRMLNEE